MDDEVLATARASAARRWMGVFMLIGVGAMMIYAAFSARSDLLWQFTWIVGGVLAFWMADRMRRATEHAIELTAHELRDTSGLRIALVADIVSLDRGVFAFKPSNGFLIRTRSPQDGVWRPGLWWRMGRRIGIGGVMPAFQIKPMAETLAGLVATRDQTSDHTT